MKRRIVIPLALFLVLACVAGRFLATRLPAGPVTISLIGYTNEPAGSEAAAAVGNEPEAIFQLANRTGSNLRCRFDFDAVCTNGLSSSSSGDCYLTAHDARRLLNGTPVGTNGWRLQSVISA